MSSSAYPKQGECWVCVEDDDDYSEKTVVDYDMAGDRCEKHVDRSNIEEITNPLVKSFLDMTMFPEKN